MPTLDEIAPDKLLAEVTDRMYDTLMGNVGLSEHHVAFDPAEIQGQEVEAWAGKIRFVTNGGQAFIVTVEQVDPDVLYYLVWDE